MQNAAKVGGVLVVFGALLWGGFSAIGKSLFPQNTTTIYAIFEDASGMNPGARVLLSGVNVGTVSKVELDSSHKAKMTLAIKEGMKIPSGTYAELPSSLTGIGEQVVLLVPGAGSQPLPALSSIAGKKKGGLDGLLPGSNDTVKELTGTLTALRKLLEDQNLTGGVKELLTSTTNTMNTFGETANSVNGLIVRNSTKFDLALASAVKSMQNVQGVTKELYALTKSGKLQGDMTAITANLRKSSEKADALMAEFTALVSDPKLKKDLQTTTGNIAEMSASGVKMAKNGEKIAEDAAAMTEDGKVISKEIVELTKKFNEIAVKINDIADDVKSTVKKVGGTIGAVAGGPKLGNIETTFDVLHESKPSHLRTDFSAVFPQTGGDYFQIGLFDAFESNKLIAQIGRKIDEQLSIRYGIFASKPGIGVDYSVGNRLSLRGDVFSLNDPRTDLRLKYDFGKGFVGWLGVNQAFKKNVPVFGFGTKH